MFFIKALLPLGIVCTLRQCVYFNQQCTHTHTRTPLWYFPQTWPLPSIFGVSSCYYCACLALLSRSLPQSISLIPSKSSLPLTRCAPPGRLLTAAPLGNRFQFILFLFVLFLVWVDNTLTSLDCVYPWRKVKSKKSRSFFFILVLFFIVSIFLFLFFRLCSF